MNVSYTTNDPHLIRFGLVREPFADTPDESFFLLDSQRAQHLNTLYHLTQHGDTPILVTGCKGSGKTSLITKFLAMGSNTWRYCLVRANAMMNPEQLLRHIADGFGIEPDSINFDNAIDSLRQRLLEIHRSGLVAILIVDDAQDLPAASLTVLMKLSELEDEASSLLRVLLFSETQIVTLLTSLGLGDMQQRIKQTLEIPALDERQTRDYLQYRLGVAGASETMPLSRRQMKLIYRESKGIPLLINKAARAILRESDKTTTAATNRHILPVAIALFVTLGLLGYFFADDILDLTADLAGQNGRTATATLELPAPRAPVANVADTPPGNPVQTAPASETVPVPLATPQTETLINQENSETSVASSGTTSDWFAGLDPEHFTLQLIGSRNRSTVESLQQQHKLGQQSAIITTQHQGAPWYVLVYGSYPDKAAARAAISDLPGPLQQASPWPRRIGDLQPAP